MATTNSTTPPDPPPEDPPYGTIREILQVYMGFSEEECDKFNKWIYTLYKDTCASDLQILTSTEPEITDAEPIDPVQFIARLVDIEKGETVLEIGWRGNGLIEQEEAEGDPRVGRRKCIRKLFDHVKGLVDVKEGRVMNGTG